MGERLEIKAHPIWVEQRGDGGDSILLFMAACPTATSCSMRSVPRWGNGINWSHFDRRGHGFTADTDAPFHYADMATEAIGVLEKVVGGRAHLVGWSDGGIVGLLVAFRRPDLVDRPVLIGVSFHFDGVLPMELDPSSPLTAVLVQSYAERSPDGEAAPHNADRWPAPTPGTTRTVRSPSPAPRNPVTHPPQHPHWR